MRLVANWGYIPRLEAGLGHERSHDLIDQLLLFTLNQQTHRPSEMRRR